MSTFYFVTLLTTTVASAVNVEVVTKILDSTHTYQVDWLPT